MVYRRMEQLERELAATRDREAELRDRADSTASLRREMAGLRATVRELRAQVQQAGGAQPAGAPPPTAGAAGRREELTGRLVIGSHGDFYFGERIPLLMILQNRGREEVTLDFDAGKRYDFQILRNGQPVWSFAANRTTPPPAATVVLKPGQKVQFTASWDQRGEDGDQVPPGRYTVRAIVETRIAWEMQLKDPRGELRHFEIVGPRPPPRRRARRR
ncbi:MAG: hypothetical protein FJX77_15765 [Armatimonadetes bacterium]|nr:hypothetical protein [Armatimonadota bacterium]